MFVHAPFTSTATTTFPSKSPKLTFACNKQTEFSHQHQGDTVMFGSATPGNASLPQMNQEPQNDNPVAPSIPNPADDNNSDPNPANDDNSIPAAVVNPTNAGNQTQH